MSQVFFSVSVSLDGYLVPPGMDLAHAGDPSFEGWGAQWGKLHSWILPTRYFRERAKLGDGGETGVDNQIVADTFERTGVSIMGKRMFELGEAMWPDEAPFHTPVFVLTNQVREPWVRPGGTTFYFVNDGTGDSHLAAVTIRVEAAGTPPVAADDSYSIAEDGALNIGATEGVLGNDSDADGDAMSALLVAGPTNGTLSLSADGSSRDCASG